jgi:MFS family permease
MRGLRFLLAATAVSMTGDGMLVAAAPLAAATLSRDPADIGFVAAASTAAWLVFGIPAGAFVDRWDLRRTMIVSDLVRAAVLGGLAVLIVTGRASIGSLAAAVFGVGVATCFFTPAGVALLRDVVGSDRRALTAANGRFWSIDAVGRSLAGPPLGAWAFGLARALPFFADAVSFALSALLLRFVPTRPRTVAPVRGGLDIGVGVRFIAADRVLRGLALSAFAFNFAYFTAFAPFVLYAQDRLGIGVPGFGLLLACGAAGSIVAGVAAARVIGGRPALTVYAYVFVAQAAAWLTVWLVPTPVAAGIGLAVIGAAAAIGTVAGQATRQLATPPGRLGRVAAVHRIASSGGGTLGALAGGFLATADAQAPFIAAVAVMGAAVIYIRPDFRHSCVAGPLTRPRDEWLAYTRSADHLWVAW